MTKVTIDRALIEQAVDAAFSPYCAQDLAILAPALRAALAEPAVDPFGYFRAEPFGWTDCAPTDEGAKALYEVPPPTEPARTSQDVCTVPLLSDEEILQLTPLCFKKYTDGVLLGHARAIEQLVRRKAGL